jgi:hypothetical protein
VASLGISKSELEGRQYALRAVDGSVPTWQHVMCIAVRPGAVHAKSVHRHGKQARNRPDGACPPPSCRSAESEKGKNPMRFTQLVVFKSGARPTDERWYLSEVLKSIGMSISELEGCQVSIRYVPRPALNQEYVIGFALESGYIIDGCTLTPFSDADGGSGFVLKVRHGAAPGAAPRAAAAPPGSLQACPKCGAKVPPWTGDDPLLVFRCQCGVSYCVNCSAGGTLDSPLCPASPSHSRREIAGRIPRSSQPASSDAASPIGQRLTEIGVTAREVAIKAGLFESDVRRIASGQQKASSEVLRLITSALDLLERQQTAGKATSSAGSVTATSSTSTEIAEVRSSGRTVNIGALEIMATDLGEKPWSEAVKACQAQGTGWRLPTRSELGTLYEHREKIGGFTTGRNSYYWSSEPYAPNSVATNSIWVCSFSTGKEDSSFKGGALFARAVRTSANVSAERAHDGKNANDHFECSRCRKTQQHTRTSDQYAGNLWVCPSCGYKSARYE